jgi:TonB family protein
MWQQVRESERTSAIESARDQARRGKCDAALNSLDRAQATLNIGVYARESTVTRARCYEVLDLTELAAAHRRLLADFYENDPMAIPKPDGSSVFRVANVSFDGHNRPPSGLKVEPPRYSAYARRSGIVGRVVISFDLSRDGRPTMIRVVEMPHPLLASWAIQAIAQARFREKEKPFLMSGEHYLTLFDFEWHWARDKNDERGS